MKEELKRIFGSKMLIATLIAVSILPLIYAGLYLWAFWDPYGKMESLPVAIVNEDKCTQKEKEIYCFGQDLVDELNSDKAMNWQFVDKATANEGLNNKKYYTLAIIPENFSKNILSVDSNNPVKAEIEFKSRQASSFMASKFTDTAFVKIKAALNEKISKEYFDNIFSETRDSVDDLNKAADGASDLVDGLLEAKDGSDDLYEGIDKANSGAVDLKNGLNTLYDGAEKLKVGSSDALIGTNRLLDGAINLNNALVTLLAGSSQLVSATDNLTNGQNVVIAKINAYIQAHPEASSSADLMTALGVATQVNSGIVQLKTGLVTTNTGTQQLVVGSTGLKNGLSSLSIGISNVATGSSSLKDGIGTARDGDQKLIEGLEDIKDGENDLGEGLADAYDGSIELRDKLGEAVDKTKEKTNENKNKIQATVMSAPVDIHDVSIDIVNNNGTGFAPYFIPLALWVGGMAIFFLVDLKLKKKNKIKEFLPKFVVSLIVSTIQVLVLDFVLVKLLGLKVNYLWQFIVFSVFLGWCITLIQMYLTLALDLAGKFVGIVLLMLQLTSSAGSYPIETAPRFFQFIAKYLPMTYAVSAFRELISGDNFSIVSFDFKIILVMFILFLVLILAYLIKPVKLLVRAKQKLWVYLKAKNKK